MTRRRVWLRFFLGEVAMFGPVYCLLAVLLCGPLQAPRLMLPALLLFAPFLLLGFARALLPNAALLLLAHVAVAALPLLLPLPALQRAAFTAALAVLAAVSLAKRLAAERTERENRETYGRGTAEEYARIRGDGAAFKVTLAGAMLAMGLNVALTLLAGVLKSEAANTMLALWAPVYMCCYLVVRQTAGLDDALAYLEGSTRQPVRPILRLDNAVLAALLVLVLVLVLPAAVLPLRQALSALGAGALALIRLLVRLLGSGGQAPPEEEAEPEAPPPAQNEMGMLPEGEAWIGWVILGYIVGVVVFLGLALLAVWAIYKLYRRFSGARGVNDGDVREFLAPSLAAAPLAGLWKRLRGRMPDFGSGERARVRRQYYKAVRRQIRLGAKVAPSQTAGEIERALAGAQGLGELTRAYEKARYGDEGS